MQRLYYHLHIATMMPTKEIIAGPVALAMRGRHIVGGFPLHTALNNMLILARVIVLDVSIQKDTVLSYVHDRKWRERKI